MSFDFPEGISAQNTPAENDRLMREHRGFGGVSASEAVEKLGANARKLAETAGYVREDRPAELKKTRTSDPQMLARRLVQQTHYIGVQLDEIYVVWYAYILGGWKALVSTNVKDNCYYEVTHNVAKGETYVDKYIKSFNTCVTNGELESLGLADI